MSGNGKLAVIGFLFGVSTLTCGQSSDEPAPEQKVHFAGYLEQFFTSGNFQGVNKTRDRLTRIGGTVESGQWRATASYWYYPYCAWYDLDDFGLQYSQGPSSLQLGRFRVPFGQDTWDDEWYSGFVFVPTIQLVSGSKAKLTERTSTGINLETTIDGKNFSLTAFDGDFESGRPAPTRLNRLAGRVQGRIGDTLVGLSYLTDVDASHPEELGEAIDFRYTIPHWIVRGVASGIQSTTRTVSGYFVDVYHRPKGWNDVTLLLRVEDFSMTGSATTRIQLVTPGVKIRLPFATQLDINYMAGPGMNQAFLGGGWAFGIHRSIQF